MTKTNNQKEISKLIISQIEFWNNMGIESPINYETNNDRVREELKFLDEEDVEDLTNFLNNLLNFIKEF